MRNEILKILSFIIIIFICVRFPISASTLNYTYDDLNRLIQVNYNDYIIIEYTYDASGNRITKEVSELDSDEDGLCDALEKNTCTNFEDADTDDDGIKDGIEDMNNNGFVNVDETNPCKIDTDGDGIQDGTEIGLTVSDVGIDTNIEVFQKDHDTLTTSDPLDADSDEDGIIDGDEDINHNGQVNPGETDPCAIDTDNDGLQDGTEMGLTEADVGEDTNLDEFQPDLDPSTTTDPLDHDTDGDGLSDGDEDTNQNGRVDEGESDPNVNKKAMPWLMLLLSD